MSTVFIVAGCMLGYAVVGFTTAIVSHRQSYRDFMGFYYDRTPTGVAAFHGCFWPVLIPTGAIYVLAWVVYKGYKCCEYCALKPFTAVNHVLDERVARKSLPEAKIVNNNKQRENP
jgi:hypothetical protein